MRTETIIKNYYTFDELSPAAQENVIYNYWNGYSWDELPWLYEDMESLKAIADHIGVTYELNNYNGDLYINLDFYYGNKTDEEMELSGRRAIAYVWNNYIETALTGKYYSTPMKQINGKYHYKNTYSKCIKEFNCPFTGTSEDYNLYNTWKEFIEKMRTNPNLKVSDFIELLADRITKSWNSNIDRIFSKEYIREDCEINEREFLEDGTAV